MYVCALSILLVLALLDYAVARYTLDFAPEFVLLSWCLLAAVWQTLRRLDEGRQVPFRLTVAGTAFYSAGVEVLMCVLLFHFNGICR
jgi:hypothetical protein